MKKKKREMKQKKNSVKPVLSSFYFILEIRGELNKFPDIFCTGI